MTVVAALRVRAFRPIAPGNERELVVSRVEAYGPRLRSPAGKAGR